MNMEVDILKYQKHELLGKKFGQLTVIEQLPTNSHGEKKWLCVCDCGNKHEATSYNLAHGKTTRCAECSYKAIAKKNITHGRTPKHMFYCYTNMKTRCYNQNYYLFQHYGGKGITVCNEWLGENGFQNFRKWSFENGYSEKMSIHRIANEKVYSPDNCRWTTMTVQQNNRTNNRMITVNGITDTMANWSRKNGIPYSTVQQRLARGWSEQDAVTIPLKGTHSK